MTSLLDVLRETDLRVGFTDAFKSLRSRENLDRETLQQPLLLCLYGLGTNTGISCRVLFTKNAFCFGVFPVMTPEISGLRLPSRADQSA